MASSTKSSPAPKKVTVDGKEYSLPVLALRELKQVQAWLDKQPSPLDRFSQWGHQLSADKFDREQDVAIAATRDWPPKIGSTEGAMALASMDGMDFVIRLLLKKGQPELTDEKIQEIADQCGPNSLEEVLGMAIGIETVKEGADPKARQVVA